MTKHMKDKQYSNVEKKQPQTVAVVGAGIIGVNCALELQQRGFKVTLFDKQGIGEGCSKGNAGHFATEQVFALAQASLLPQLPMMLLSPNGPISISPKLFFKAIPWFLKFLLSMKPSNAQKISQALKALNLNAINYYRPWLKAADCEELLSANGALLVYETTTKADIKKQQDKFLQAGVNVQLLDREQILTLEPDIHANIKFALFFPDVAHTVDPHKLCFKLTELANKLGAEYLKRSVEKVIQKNNQVELVTEGKTYLFDKVVIASGVWSKSLITQLGYRFPIQAERGYHVALETHATLTRPITSAERKFIMTPMNNGLRVSGTVEYASLDTPANYKRANALIHHAKFTVNRLPKERTTDSRWMGARPSLPDSLPVICQAPNHHNIFFAAGHHHLGLTQGAITGRLIGQLILEEATDIDITPYSISRF